MYSTLLFSLAGLLAVLLLGTIIQAFQNAFLSPLRKVPGPWWASVTGLPTTVAILSRRQVHFYHDLHRRFGQYVRVGPDEVITADVAAFKQIHRIGTPWVKSRFYQYLNPTEAGKGPFSVFAEVDPAQHAKKRKLLSRGFTQHFLRSNWEPAVQEKVANAVDRIKSECWKDGEVDILKWWLFMAADIVSQLMFGESFDTMKLGQKIEWFGAIEETNIANAIAWYFPLMYRVLKLTPVPAIQRSFSGHERLFERGKAATTNAHAGSMAKNIFASVLAEAEKDEGTLTDTEIIVEAGAFNIAGTDTTANTLTYLVWAVLSDSSLQKALEEEVVELDDPIADSKLETLPILNAVIKETLRLYGAAPGALPRIAPISGVKLGEYLIPGGTTVSTQAWSLHRQPDIFCDPDRFDHTRWLPDASVSEEAKAAFSPFGAGSRVCIGIHLAYMELRLATTLFFRECRGATLSPSTTPESMEVENIFLIAPKAGECRVRIPLS